MLKIENIKVRWSSTMDWAHLSDDGPCWKDPRVGADGWLAITGRLSNETYAFPPDRWMEIKATPSVPPGRWGIFLVGPVNDICTYYVVRAKDYDAARQLVQHCRGETVSYPVECIGDALVDEFPRIIVRGVPDK